MPPAPSPISHEKQTFLNTVYERFFQGFCVKVADTHGHRYTPQPLVNFMVAASRKILTAEFGKNARGQGCPHPRPIHRHRQFIVNISGAF